MRAVIRKGSQLFTGEIPEPVPSDGQVLVKSLACGICGSDIHALKDLDHMVEVGLRAGAPDTLDPKADLVFGHEFCAEILDYGPKTNPRLRPGTHVVSLPFALGPKGMELVGYSNRFPGGFAERMVLTEALLLEVPNGLPARSAALTEPMAVGEHAVVEAKIERGTIVLVIGCGPVGIAVIAALKRRGHGPIIAADFSSTRRSFAEKMGADVVIDPALETPHSRWSQYGAAADLADFAAAALSGRQLRNAVTFDCVGAPGMLQSLIEKVPPASQIMVVGVCTQPDRIEPAIAINKQLNLRFVFAYNAEEFAATLRAIAEGEIDVEPLITDTVSLANTADAFNALLNPEKQMKILVEPGRA